MASSMLQRPHTSPSTGFYRPSQVTNSGATDSRLQVSSTLCTYGVRVASEVLKKGSRTWSQHVLKRGHLLRGRGLSSSIKKLQQSWHGRGCPICNAADVRVAESENEQGASPPAPEPQDLTELREQFCCDGVEFQEVSGLCLAVLKLAEGSAVRVVLEGGRVIAWRAVMYHKGKEELIYSKVNRTRAEGDSLLRGGIAVSFPEAAGGAAGTVALDRSGLASLIRSTPWQVVSTWSDGDAFSEIVLTLESSPATRAVWDHAFRLRYSVHLMPGCLVTVLHCHNTDSRPFSFSASLDSHLAVIDPAGAHVTGLEGAQFLARTQRSPNWKAKGAEKQQNVQLGKGVERFYCKPQFDVSLFDRGGYRTINLVQEGFEDVVLLDPRSSESEETFVCLGPGNAKKITLLPGETWEGRQTLTI